MSEEIRLSDLRAVLGKRVDAAHYQGDDTIITKDGQPHAAIVSYQTYLAATCTESVPETITDSSAAGSGVED